MKYGIVLDGLVLTIEALNREIRSPRLRHELIFEDRLGLIDFLAAISMLGLEDMPSGVLPEGQHIYVDYSFLGVTVDYAPPVRYSYFTFNSKIEFLDFLTRLNTVSIAWIDAQVVPFSPSMEWLG